MSKRKHALDIAYFCVILILVLVILYSGLRILESTVLYQGNSEAGYKSKNITRDGVDYWPRQDITTVLVMGIDQYGPVEDSGSYSNQGMADMVTLLIFDESREVCNILYLNRDTMMTIPALGIGGKPAGTIFGQLAISHTFGNGLQESCLNTRKTISDFLYGIQIDYYLAMNMDAISILNDELGGVTVNVTDDFSLIDPSITMGEITLNGEQALNFVRTRKDVGDQLNISRIERHREYTEGFVDALKVKVERDHNFVTSAYERVSPYIVTDCTVSIVSSMIERFEGYTINEIVTPEGRNVMGEQFFEFYVDEAKLDSLILRLFYAPKK